MAEIHGAGLCMINRRGEKSDFDKKCRGEGDARRSGVEKDVPGKGNSNEHIKISLRVSLLCNLRTDGEIDLAGQDQEVVISQSTLSVPPGVHQLPQRESVPGFVLFQGSQRLVGREVSLGGGGHLGLFWTGFFFVRV